jgi:hypothetical protein
MCSRTRLWPILSLSFLLLPLTIQAQTPFPGEEMTLSQRVTLAVEGNDLKELQAVGPKAIPPLLFLYETEEVEHALMGDIRSSSVELRLAVYYALGRVSKDPEVVATLLDILQNDPNPLLRDKAACALAYDQIHLKKPEKVQLYAGLIQALSNPERQVQAVAIQALSILTGETKGFSPVLGADRQQRSIEMWQRWLGELQAEQ